MVAFDKINSITVICSSVKVTVHVGAVQNFEIEIFAENKYTFNELLVKTYFSIRLIVCEI